MVSVARPSRLTPSRLTSRLTLGDEDLAAPGELLGIDDEAYRLLDAHDETGHLRIGEGDRAAFLDLLVKDGDHGAARTQDVAEAGGGEDRPLVAKIAVGGGHELFAHELGGAHHIGGIDRLVGAGEDDLFNLAFTSGIDDILDAVDIGLHRLKRRFLAEDNVLQGGSMKNNVNAPHLPR